MSNNSSSTVKIYVDFERFTERNNWQVKVQNDCTVCQLQWKLRKFAKLEESEGIFLFFQYYSMFGIKKERLYPGNKTLAEIKQELGVEIIKIKMLIDNAFGDLDSRFINATIKELNIGVWVLTINYSFYSLYEYKTVDVFKSMDDAVKKLALERCNGKLIITDKSNVVVDIIPK